MHEVSRMEDKLFEEVSGQASETDDFYNKSALEGFVDDDEISPYEEAFMSGYVG